MHREYLGLSPRIASKFANWKKTSAVLLKLNTLMLEMDKLEIDTDDNTNFCDAWPDWNQVYIQITGGHNALEEVTTKIKSRFNCTFESEINGSSVEYYAKNVLGCTIQISHYPTDCPTKEVHVPATTKLVVDCGANL